jgi:hypothetical protein
MRNFVRRTFVVGAAVSAIVGWAGCKGKQVTQYVTGISTQVAVPRDLKAVRIEVSVDGVVQFCRGYRVYDGKVQLPRSLGSFAATDDAITRGPITFTVSGVTDADLNNDFFGACTTAKVGDANVRIIRRSRQPYIREEILFLPMPLAFSCFDKSCGEGQTCKGGTCVSDTLSDDEIKALPDFSEDLVDGSGGGCFQAKICMGSMFPALAVDSDTCTYAVANSPSAPTLSDPTLDPFRPACTTAANCTSGICTAGRCEALPADTPWSGTNVEITYDGGLNREILSLDPNEGFLLPDPTKPQRFKLAPGLCAMVKGFEADGKPTAHRITAVRASGICRARRSGQPFCTADQLALMSVDPQGISSNPTPPNDCSSLELKPPKSALMLVVDSTQGHAAFFDEKQIKALELPLRDPAFQTTDLGLMFAPVPSAGCDSAAPAKLAFEPAQSARQKVIDELLAFAAVPTKLVSGAPSYEGALKSAYEQLSALPSPEFYRRAVLVLGNRDFNTESCAGISGTPSILAASALNAAANPGKSVRTYALQIVKTDPSKALLDDVLDPGLLELSQAGSATPVNSDARSGSKASKDAFQQIVSSLSTCVYDVADDARAPGAGDTITYSDPVGGTTAVIASNAACSSDDAPGAGWGYGASPSVGKKRIFLCADSCTAYRTMVANASNLTNLYAQPATAVPLFTHKQGCETK